MRTDSLPLYNFSALLLFFRLIFCQICFAARRASSFEQREARDASLLSARAWSPHRLPRAILQAPSQLPIQIGCILGFYGATLVLVAILLLVLSKKRREHLLNGDSPVLLETTFDPFPELFGQQSEADYNRSREQFECGNIEAPIAPPRTFSPLSNRPTSPNKISPVSPSSTAQSWVYPSPTSTMRRNQTNQAVNQDVFAKDKKMAQQQLDDMYKYVMEHEQAKHEGRQYQGPFPLPSPSAKPYKCSSSTGPGTLKREKNKPSSLNLAQEEKSLSSFFSILRSPRKNKEPKGISISSPVSLTPMSSRFARPDEQESRAIPPRLYAPLPPPPVPTDQLPYRRSNQSSTGRLLTPDPSPIGTGNESIAERINVAFGDISDKQCRDTLGRMSHAVELPYDVNANANNISDSRETDNPKSAMSNKFGEAALVGLPSSPKPGVNRFHSLASLPSSPRPGPTFPTLQIPPSNSRSPPAPAAIRTNGALPLRAYDAASSAAPSSATTTQQVVFTRAQPMSPGITTGLHTPYTGTAVPYSPYQPFSPVVPITPRLVTKADRKRMKRLEPKTPTVEMVKGDDEMW